GGDLKTDRYTDFHAGQKKNTTVTATCGSTSRYGRTRFGKTVRFTPRPSLVGGGELLEQRVRFRDRVVEALLHRLLAPEDVLHLVLDHVADLHEVAEPEALAVRRRDALGLGRRGLLVLQRGGRRGRQARELRERGVLLRVPHEVVALLQVLHRGIRDREVARVDVPPHLLLGLGEELEELRHAAVLLLRLALHDPQR